MNIVMHEFGIIRSHVIKADKETLEYSKQYSYEMVE